MAFHRKNLDISAYLVVGPENTLSRPVPEIVSAAVKGGFTCVQLRSKTATAREMIALSLACSRVLRDLGAAERVALLVNDRLDVALAARAEGADVAGVHVGQDDIPPAVCRTLLGEDAVVGLSAPTEKVFEYVASGGREDLDYYGAGPLRATPTKPDCGRLADGTVLERTFADIARLAEASPLPVVFGGGVKSADLSQLAATGIGGFFVVSAVAGAENPEAAAREMCRAWRAHRA